MNLPTVPVATAYGRLSRQDVRKGETVDNHIAILLELARQEGIPLATEDVIFEIESSATLDNREGIQRLLELCRQRLVTHVLVFDISRMTRGLENDWADIKRAFFRGKITLVTPRGNHLFDDNLDTTLLDIEAVLNRRYRWEFSLKRKIHNRQRFRDGKLSQGYAAYGYKWNKEEKRFEVIEEEYEVLREMLGYNEGETFHKGLIWSGGAPAIQIEFNARLRENGKPLPPGVGKTKRASQFWNVSAIHRICTNPFYAGRPAHRHTIRRNGDRETLPESEWIYSDIEQDYPHPLTWEQFEDLRRLLSGRKRQGAPRGSSPFWLTGLLVCAEERRVHSFGRSSYSCHCYAKSGKHVGMSLSSTIAERAIGDVIKRVIEALPDKMAPALREVPSVNDHAARLRQYRAALKTLQQAEEYLKHLRDHSAMFLRTWGPEAYETQYCSAEESFRKAETAAGELGQEVEMHQPPDVESLTLLIAIKRTGLDDWWNEATPQEKRGIAARVIQRVQILPGGDKLRSHCREIRVHLRPTFAPFLEIDRVSVRQYMMYTGEKQAAAAAKDKL